MKRFILIVLVALSFFSCTDSIDENIPNCGNIRNVAYESFRYCGELKEKPTKPVYVIINSNEDLQKKFTTCETFAVILPDFTQKRILGLFSGPKPTGGYGIKIESVVEDDCQILVEYSEKSPGTDPVTQVITYPADYIVLPKSNKPFLFSKVNPIVDYGIVGSYVANPATTQCVGDCNAFYKIEKYKVVKYLNTNSFPADFNNLQYKALAFMDDYADFLLKLPTEIKNLKGQTKTYGTPGIDNHSGVYFEYSEAGVVTKIYLDIQNTTDQTGEVIAFKKVIQDKITALKTKS